MLTWAVVDKTLSAMFQFTLQFVNYGQV